LRNIHALFQAKIIEKAHGYCLYRFISAANRFDPVSITRASFTASELTKVHVDTACVEHKPNLDSNFFGD
jgi:hypothetical protein